MNLNPELRVPKKRTALLWIVLLALLGSAGYFAYDYLTSGPKPWYARWQIKRYLHKQTGQSSFKGDFNFNLAADVSKLQAQVTLLETNVALFHTNSARLQKEINTLYRLINLQTELNRKQAQLTNRLQELHQTLAKIPDALTNYPLSVLTNADAMQKEAAPLKAVVDPVYEPLKPLRDEIAALEKTADEKQQTLAPQRREIAALQRQLTSGKRTDGTNEVTLTADDLAALTNKLAEIRAAMAPALAEIQALNKEINAKQQEHNDKLKDVAAQLRVYRLLTSRASDLAGLQANVARLQADISAAQQDLDSRAKDAGLPAATLAERRAAIDARQQELAALRAKYNTQLTELTAKRRELYNLRTTLDAQQTDYTAQFRRKFDDCKTYGQMYVLIGQQLAVASQLLDRADTNQQRSGLYIAYQAANYSANIIENFWLAARIHEGYVLPNLALANDPRPRGAFNQNAILQQAIQCYQEAQESNRLVAALEVLVRHAKTDAEADNAKFMLGREYENAARYADALATYKSIKATNSFKWLNSRIAWLENRLKNKK